MKFDYEHLTPHQNCPACGHPLSRAGGEEQRPEAGDLTVCLACGAALSFGPGLLLVKADLSALGFDELAEIRLIQHTLARAKKHHGH